MASALWACASAYSGDEPATAPTTQATANWMLDEPVSEPGTARLWREVGFRIVTPLPPSVTEVVTASGMKIKKSEQRYETTRFAPSDPAASTRSVKWPASGWVKQPEPPLPSNTHSADSAKPVTVNTPSGLVDNAINIDAFRVVCVARGLVPPNGEVWEEPSGTFNVGMRGLPRAGDVRVTFSVKPVQKPIQPAGQAWLAVVLVVAVICIVVYVFVSRSSKKRRGL